MNNQESFLKNPFAFRDGRILTIHDISRQENGKACGCTCPECGAPFIARMGDKKTWHFAHSGEPCNAEKLRINSIYKLACQAMLELGRISYPGYYVKCDVTDPFANLKAMAQFSSVRKSGYKSIFPPDRMNVKTAEPVMNSDGIAEAILVNGGSLALRLIIDSDYCPGKYNCQPYENFATIGIRLGNEAYTENYQTVAWLITSNPDNRFWIYTNQTDKWLKKKDQEMEPLREKAREAARIAEEARQREEERRKAELRARWEEQARQEEAVQKYLEEQKEQRRREQREALERLRERKKDQLEKKYGSREYKPEIKPHRKERCFFCGRIVPGDQGKIGRVTKRFVCDACVAEGKKVE